MPLRLHSIPWRTKSSLQILNISGIIYILEDNSHIKICNSHLKACLATPYDHDPCQIMTTKRRAQPHNAYNIFFILERKRLIYELEGSVVDNNQQMSYDLDGYENLCLPNLPPKFQHLHLPPGWFVPGKNSKRKHAKTHGSKF